MIFAIVVSGYCGVAEVGCIGVGFARGVSQAGWLCLDAGNQAHEGCEWYFEAFIPHHQGYFRDDKGKDRPCQQHCRTVLAERLREGIARADANTGEKEQQPNLPQR